ncbi:DMT family transporter [Pseudomonas sp. UBA6310]|uniref:DMT family transporter n=1 Tax=Pseudomonas sp. UBA6310 TaxID=1947327 RepID=UPI00257D9B67|nr:DMT family transporter [Pseudomonas sp. UBA6310]
MRAADYLRLISLAAIWGASFLFVRMLVPQIGTLPTAFGRVSMACLGLALIVLVLRIRWDFRGLLGRVLLLGVISAGLPFAMYAVAAQHLPAGYLAIFNATTPLMGVLIGALFFGESLTASKGAGVLLGLAGVAVLSRTGPVAFDLNLAWGAAACLVATSCYGLSGFLTRRWVSERGGLDSRLLALASQVGATLSLLPLMLWALPGQSQAHWGDPLTWAALVGLGVVCTAFAFILYFRLIADIGPVKSMTVAFLVPAFGVFWGVLLLDEELSWAYLYGGVLIALALWLVLRPPRDEAK